MADSHDDFPEYPLQKAIPGKLPLINYPEISMWGLHPWGGYGANPLPDRFERLWKQVKDAVAGGIAYSEGIFDDVNKIVVSQFYWNKDTTAKDTLIEYISYEFSHKAVDEIREIIRLIEKNQTVTADGILGTYANTRADLDAARAALRLVQKVDQELPPWAKCGWRWRILVLRAVLDLERYERAFEQRDQLTPETRWTDVLKGSEAAKEAMEEIVRIFHSNLNYDDAIHPMYRHVRPAIQEI